MDLNLASGLQSVALWVCVRLTLNPRGGSQGPYFSARYVFRIPFSLFTMNSMAWMADIVWNSIGLSIMVLKAHLHDLSDFTNWLRLDTMGRVGAEVTDGEGCRGFGNGV